MSVVASTRSVLVTRPVIKVRSLGSHTAASPPVEQRPRSKSTTSRSEAVSVKPELKTTAADEAAVSIRGLDSGHSSIAASVVVSASASVVSRNRGA